ncbi:MAG TPA: GNAT family N-acetyltransferase [Blastocatellia bacterium]|nr:GNAT family N-acetyltransferase [Blastocatellia bacterium]
MTTISINTASTSEQENAIGVVVLAFSADPVARWYYPDPHDYLTYFPRIVRAFGGKAFQHGTGYYADGFSGAALWIPPDVPLPEEELAALLARSVPESRQAEAFSIFEQMGSYHPAEPHWYLPLIGVDPARQGKGYGSALMKHALAPCDREKRLAYLESSNPRNIPLYERFGFEVMGTIQAGTSPPIYPMLRRPRSD